MLDGSLDLIKWGDWGWAARVQLAYTHPRTGAPTTIEELVRVRPGRLGVAAGRGRVVCWGVLPSGRLRHPVFVERPVSRRGTPLKGR